MIRCPIYACSKLSGCNACKVLNYVIEHQELTTILINRPNWVEVSNIVQEFKDKDIPIGVVTAQPLPREIVWDLSYSSKNVLQVNCCLADHNFDWIVELVHLSEICGLFCNVVLYPILPSIITSADVIKVLDAIRNCEHCRIILKFGELKLNSFICENKHLKLGDHSIPLNYMIKCDEFMWKCSESYAEEFYQLVKFYTDVINMDIVIV